MFTTSNFFSINISHRVDGRHHQTSNVWCLPWRWRDGLWRFGDTKRNPYSLFPHTSTRVFLLIDGVFNKCYHPIPTFSLTRQVIPTDFPHETLGNIIFFKCDLLILTETILLHTMSTNTSSTQHPITTAYIIFTTLTPQPFFVQHPQSLLFYDGNINPPPFFPNSPSFSHIYLYLKTTLSVFIPSMLQFKGSHIPLLVALRRLVAIDRYDIQWKKAEGKQHKLVRIECTNTKPLGLNQIKREAFRKHANFLVRQQVWRLLSNNAHGELGHHGRVYHLQSQTPIHIGVENYFSTTTVVDSAKTKLCTESTMATPHEPPLPYDTMLKIYGDGCSSFTLTSPEFSVEIHTEHLERPGECCNMGP